MTTATPVPEAVLETVETIGPPGTPVTTPEVAEAYDCTQRTIYNRLESLAEEGRLETKKVGARGRVWWRPPAAKREGAAWTDRLGDHPVFDSEMVGVILWDEDLTIEAANDAFLEMTGLDHEEAMGTSWRELTPEEFYPNSERHIEELEATGSGVPYEKQYFHADGSRWWGLFESRELTDDRFVEFVIDITDRKAATRELQREADLDAYRVDLADAIRPLSDPGQIQHQAARLLGTRLGVDRAHYAELVEDGTTFRITADYFREDVASVVGEYDLDDFGSSIAAAFDAGETVVVPDVEARSDVGPAERAMYAETEIGAWVGVPIKKDGTCSAFFGVTDADPRQWTDTEVAMIEETADRTWDAVQRAAIETELRTSEARLSKILAQLPVGVGVVDEDGVFELRNDRMATLVDGDRIPSADPEQRPHWTATDEDGTELPPDRWPAATALDGDPMSPGIEFRVDRGETPRWLDVAAVPFQGPADGRKAIVVVQDITDRKDAEAALEESRAELAAELEAMRELHGLSTELLQEERLGSLADMVVDTAVEFVDADAGSLQLYDPQQEDLELVAHRGLTETAVATWTRVGPEDDSTCGRALRTGDHVAVPDVEDAAFMADTDVLETFREVGIRAVQTTPLVSRSGDVLGMVSTHWSQPHTISDRDRQHLELLARQTADRLEHQQTIDTLRTSEATLERLNEASQTLLELDADAIPDRVPPLVRRVLHVEYAALWRYDADTGDLRRWAVDADEAVTVTAPTPEWSDRVWETFVDTETHVGTVPDDARDHTSVGSRALVPLGRHGVVCLGAVPGGGIDDRTIEFAETVAATVETTWNRAASERELERQNEELTRLDSLNTLIRQLDQSLVAADSRTAIETAVCERLAESDRYAFAWIGDRDPGADAIEPRAWAGVDSSYLEEITVSLTDVDADPIARALDTGDLQVVSDIATDGDVASWRAATLDRDARSLVSIPLVYGEATYGVLTVYADQPERGERNRAVLAELGDTIAHAINARETRATLQTDSVVELTLRFPDADTPLSRLARAAEGTIEYQGAIPRDDGGVDVFVLAREAATEAWESALETSLAIESLDRLTDRPDGTLFRAHVAEPTLARRCAEGGVVVRSLSVDPGGATAVLDIPNTATVPEVSDRLEASGLAVELRARQPRERPLRTRQTFVATIEDQLTDRQREVLQTAYLSGYFETPRVSTGQEVTEMVGVSQPTFAEHLRAAERTICSVLFEEEPTRP